MARCCGTRQRQILDRLILVKSIRCCTGVPSLLCTLEASCLRYRWSIRPTTYTTNITSTLPVGTPRRFNPSACEGQRYAAAAAKEASDSIPQFHTVRSTPLARQPTPPWHQQLQRCSTLSRPSRNCQRPPRGDERAVGISYRRGRRQIYDAPSYRALISLIRPIVSFGDNAMLRKCSNTCPYLATSCCRSR